ncbi:MAG: sensor histidine kinase N-terminal domain-containing protein [Rubrivivax sp.]|nr:sensor histidine kinase N-terminal domain-containing protein [Rubrivivax sp.]
MSLQRRLLLILLLCAPLVWGAALWASVDRARSEVDELFDTELIRFAQKVQATLAVGRLAPGLELPPAPVGGEADLRDLAIAVWDAEGRVLLGDREGVALPHRTGSAGFVDLVLGGDAWRVYYLPAPGGQSLVATGQRMHERDEMVQNLVGSQMLPWLAVLPVLMVLMAWAVRQALAPLRQLTGELQHRRADDLQPVAVQAAPADLRPLLAAMNGLFERIGQALERERRFTADAAHELRTPLAVLHAQWDVLRRAADGGERAAAAARLDAGFDRIERLVEQLLVLSRVEASAPAAPASVDWPPLVEQVMSDVLPLAERRRIELACDWPPEGELAFPLQGQPELLAVLLRNLLDNAVRYAPEGGTATLRFTAAGLEVENDGPPLPAETRAHLGERFHRQAGQAESGSGLGVSIVLRIAALHGLAVHYGTRADGQGVRAEVKRAMVDAAVQAGPAGLAGPHVSAA